MGDEPCIIRQSKRSQYGFVILSGMMILWYFVGPYEKTRIMYAKSPKFTIILGIVMFGLFFYFLNELIKRRAEIILTKEGIELNDKGFFDWKMIESFSTLYYIHSENYSIELILHFKEFADMKFNISYLEKSKEELADLILKYKGSSSLFFAGHNSK
jgi:hypothetical protein